MKLTIALEKIGRFTIELPESQANDKFKSLVVGLLDTSTKCIKEVKAVTGVEEKVAEAVKKENTFQQRSLILMKCPACEEIMAPLIDVDGNSKIITCRSCGHDREIAPAELFNVRYDCASCGQTATFQTDGSLSEVKCKRCSSPIDLIFHEKKNMYLSPNLMR
jgi:DNA-directed RNA polymerase subunit RPC12/RpoP